jgi:hypothetical protein
MKCVLDCAAVVKHFGGLAKCSRLLRQYGVNVSVDAVEKWRRRQSIPANQLVNLAWIAKMERMRFDLYDFICGDTNDDGAIHSSKRAA